jgi:hypothetical protein
MLSLLSLSALNLTVPTLPQRHFTCKSREINVQWSGDSFASVFDMSF